MPVAQIVHVLNDHTKIRLYQRAEDAGRDAQYLTRFHKKPHTVVPTIYDAFLVTDGEQFYDTMSAIPVSVNEHVRKILKENPCSSSSPS